MERTYTFRADGQSVRCEPTEIGLLTTIVRLTGSTFYCQPGARSSGVPDEVTAILQDIDELRGAVWSSASDAEARIDVLVADLEQHIHQCRQRLNRVLLFGAWGNPPARPELDDNPFEPSARSKPAKDWSTVASNRLVSVLVPPGVRRCQVVASFANTD